MPLLSDISKHFDDIDIFDGYSRAKLFKGQVSSFNETSPDGSTNKKRTISVVPGTVMPPRRVISYFDEMWIVGDGNTDGLQNRALRTAYWTRKVIDLAIRLTPGEVCNDIPGYELATSKEYLKDTVNYVTDSDYDPQWDFTISISENVFKGQFISTGSKLFRVRSVHTTAGGFLLANADELDGSPRVPVTLTTVGDYDPVLDTRAGVVTNTFGIFFDPSKLFRFASQADPRILSGDMTLILAMPAPVGSLVSLARANWKVLTSTPELDGYNLHIRRA
jgi:hypothetical protein